jgi:hypothetical protein
MGTIAAYVGVLLLVLGGPVVFLVIMIYEFWQRRSRRRELLEYYREDIDLEWNVQEHVRESTAHRGGRNERIAVRVFTLIPVGWVLAAILYFIYGQ